MPIDIPGGVEVKIDGQAVTVKGPKGELALTVASPIEVAIEENQVVVTRPDDERNSRSLHGLTRTLIANQIIGVTQGYYFFNAAPYVLTLLIMIASTSPKRSLKGAPGELSITK